MTDALGTPKHGHAPIRMERTSKSGFWGRAKLKTGDFYWRVEEPSGRRLLCVLIPCQSAESGYTFAQFTIGFLNASGAQWDWDGNEDAPTLTPSVHAVGVWHGFVTNGELIEA